MSGTELGEFRTTVVGSYPQPAWLIDRSQLRVPRVRRPELWKVGDDALAEALDDAVRLAIADQLAAGVEVITDGECRRESYSNLFANSLGGIDPTRPGSAPSRVAGAPPMVVPRVIGELRRIAPVEVDEVVFARPLVPGQLKVTLPGPFTLSQQAEDNYYHDEEALALAYAAVCRAEIADLFAAGADVVQLDEPFFAARPDKARAFGLTALGAALRGAAGRTAVHLCFGYAAMVPGRPAAYEFLTELGETEVDEISIETAQSGLDCAPLAELVGKTIILGVLDLSSDEVESPEEVVRRAERALPFVDPTHLVLAPDCGMKFRSRAAARAKLGSMCAAARLLRGERD